MDERCSTLLERMNRLFLDCPDPDKRERDDGWSVREIAGHLIDSANNNIQRLQRYIPGGVLAFPAYDQAAFVARAGYGEFDYRDLLTFWQIANRLLLHIAGHIPKEHLTSSFIAVGDHPPRTISALIDDYFTHMERHERQVRRILGL
jgi:hypothetical protein